MRTHAHSLSLIKHHMTVELITSPHQSMISNCLPYLTGHYHQQITSIDENLHTHTRFAIRNFYLAVIWNWVRVQYWLLQLSCSTMGYSSLFFLFAVIFTFNRYTCVTISIGLMNLSMLEGEKTNSSNKQKRTQFNSKQFVFIANVKIQYQKRRKKAACDCVYMSLCVPHTKTRRWSMRISPQNIKWRFPPTLFGDTLFTQVNWSANFAENSQNHCVINFKIVDEMLRFLQFEMEWTEPWSLVIVDFIIYIHKKTLN